MKKILFLLFIHVFSFLISNCSEASTNNTQETAKTIVGHFGALQVNGRNLADSNGDIVVLSGMSLFWSQWGGKYYNSETVRWLVEDWKCTVIRAAIGVENGGYLENPQQGLLNAYAVIDACINSGIYVIVDWHDHHAEEHTSEAAQFFSAVSEKYGNHSNLIYEIYNEPLDVSWNDVLKPYAETVITEIRKNDPDNLIIMGTRNWSQDVQDVIGNEIDDLNIAYVLHFYSSTHKQDLRDKGIMAMNAGIPLFISEWGLSEASGTGNINIAESNKWFAFLEDNNLSWCNWSIIDKDETSAALKPTTTRLSGWDATELTQSGNMIRNYLIQQNSPVFDLLK